MDEQDSTLQAIGSLAREQLDAREQEWSAFTVGELDEDQVADALRSSLGDEEFERNLEYFRPLDELSRARISANLIAQLSGEGSSAPETPAAASASAQRSTKPRWRGLVATLLPIAAAAALVLWIGGRPGTDGGPGDTRVELPTYHLEVGGGLESKRAVGPRDAGSNKYAPDTEIEVVLRPAQNVGESVQARLYAFDEQGNGRVVDTTIEVAASGSARLKGPVRALLPLEPGTWRLVFALGANGQLPTDPAKVRDLTPHRAHDGLWIAEYTVELLDGR